MTRKLFLQKYFVRFAVMLVLVSLLVYVFYHIVGSSSASLMRTPVRTITDEQIVSADAYLFRDERLLTVSGAGLVNELVESGVKVSHSVPLLELWDGVDPLILQAAQSRLDVINRAISVLEKSTEGGVESADVYRTDAMQAYQTICRAVREGDFSSLDATEEKLLISLNRYAALSGSRAELDEALHALRTERSALLQGSCTTIKNEGASGYFYGRAYVDGYERYFTKEALFSADANGFFELIETAPDPYEGEFAVGKTVHGYDWYLGVAFEGSVQGLFTEGERYTFRLPENRGRELEMTCERLQTAADGRIVAIFSSIEVPPDLLYLRAQRVEITVATTTGYYIPDAALWSVNSVIGVYIFEDSTVYFRRIDVLYRGDGYCIAAEQGDRGGDYLAADDILITSGRNLYDGKVFK